MILILPRNYKEKVVIQDGEEVIVKDSIGETALFVIIRDILEARRAGRFEAESAESRRIQEELKIKPVVSLLEELSEKEVTGNKGLKATE